MEVQILSCAHNRERRASHMLAVFVWVNYLVMVRTMTTAFAVNMLVTTGCDFSFQNFLAMLEDLVKEQETEDDGEHWINPPRIARHEDACSADDHSH